MLFTDNYKEDVVMQEHVHEGYFDNGIFYTNDKKVIKIPERHQVSISWNDGRANKKAKATPPKKRPVADLMGTWSGQIWMSDDFDEPLEEMREYME
jgi:hypothetical protein